MIKVIAFLCLFQISLWAVTLEEKIGQLFIVHFHGEEANEESQKLIQELHVGGFIYYNWANGLTSPHQVRNLSSSLQSQAKNRSLLLCIDQEGGRVCRLKHGFTHFPSNLEVAMHEPAYAEEIAFIMGKELLDVGINLNLAPVVDIHSNQQNPVIGNRSFGNSPEIVIPFAGSALTGYRNAGILSCLKHYPGHGDTAVDSHKSLPVVPKTIPELYECELQPFFALSPCADVIMTAHILLPALDLDNCATLSPTILGLLRDQMGFDGVIMTDSLVMEGLLQNCPSLEEAAVRAVLAGCDLILLGGKRLSGQKKTQELSVDDVERVVGAIVDVVYSGRIPAHRIDEAWERVVKLKQKLH